MKKKEIKKDRWSEDTMILISREARAKLKIKSALNRMTLKEYLEEIAFKK